MCAAVLAAGCRRPAPEDPWAWEKNPGLDPYPTGQTLEGKAGPALTDIGFRLDPARGTKEIAAEAQPATEEEALYLKAALSGQAWAQTKLGMRSVQEDDLQRIGEGLRWLNAAADQNDTEALRVLSALAANGRGMEQSDKESYKYMSRAAELGSPEAQYELANMLANGRGMARDMEAAIIWGRKAAEQGHAPAQLALGRMLVSSVDSARVEEGMGYIKRAADGGNKEALFLLAGAIASGDYGMVKDELKAEAMARPEAEAGDAEFQFALATLYLRGDSFADKRAEGMSWLQSAAEKGHPGAVKALEQMKNPPQ
jgi:TPR repeat protein